ncbi:MAG TPA: MarR family transcriptional regulator [Streptosporangiaceae bacterium]|nr:MarR family transcriptional regulator [Streptosporangiaceae bacterium]
MTGERPEALQAWTAVCDVVDRARIAVNRDLQHAVGLTLAENLVLCQVAMAPGRSLRMADIAGLLTIARSAVTKTVDRLEDRGLIAREKDSADRRAVHATLTAEGDRLFRAAQPAFVAAVQRHFADHISQAEVRCLAGLAGRVPQSAPASPAPAVREPA